MPRYAYSFDRVAGIYDTTRLIPAEAADRFVQAFGELSLQGRFLEVGVGTGRLALPLQKAGHSIVGTDVSREMIRIARTKGLEGAVFADAGHLPFATATFEGAMTNHVLHLLGDWRSAIREICRVTRGVYLTVTEKETETPHLIGAYSRILDAHGEPTAQPGIHERDMPALLPPNQLVPLGNYHTTQDAGEAIDILAYRSMSCQWFVSEKSHLEAIAALRAEHAGATIVTDLEINMAVWKISQLLDFAEHGKV